MNMNDNQPDRARLRRFFLWLAHPTGIHSLRSVLARLRDVELLHLMKDIKSRQAATLAWAEYGRRHGLAVIDFHMPGVDILDVEVRDLTFAHTVALA